MAVAADWWTPGHLRVFPFQRASSVPKGAPDSIVFAVPEAPNSPWLKLACLRSGEVVIRRRYVTAGHNDYKLRRLVSIPGDAGFASGMCRSTWKSPSPVAQTDCQSLSLLRATQSNSLSRFYAFFHLEQDAAVVPSQPQWGTCRSRASPASAIAHSGGDSIAFG